MSSTTAPSQVATRDKSAPWYAPEISQISPAARELFENYSHVPAERVIPHILEVVSLPYLLPFILSNFVKAKALYFIQRNRAWDIWPYPCIGQFRFLDFSISLSPLYSSVLSRLCTHSHTLLDLGCCFAQDVRKLVADGAPGENIWGFDLRPDFIELGYELFMDKGILKSHFMTGDVFDEHSRLKELNGNIDIIHAGSFFHLFDWNQQVQVAKRMVEILRPRAGSLVLGRQVGNMTAGEFLHRTNEKGTMYRHNEQSLERMWKEVGEVTRTEWKVKARLDTIWQGHPALEKGREWTGEQSWQDKESRRLTFEVERLS